MAKTIMIIDDEESILEVVSAVLTQEGYSVIKISSGKEALEKLKSVKPDLILLDYFMPGMSGGDVLEKIRADDELKELKVIFLTAAAGLWKYEKLNILDYIKKPFDNKDLIQRIKNVIER